MEHFAWARTGRRTARQRVTQSTCLSTDDHLSLTDILYKAPRVLELVSPHDKKTLVAVCMSIRQSVHAFASSISLQEGDTLQHLFNTAVGPRLQKLDLQGVKLTAAAVPGLTSAPWSAPTSLTLSKCGLNASFIRKLAARDWPMLHHLSVRQKQAQYSSSQGHGWQQLASVVPPGPQLEQTQCQCRLTAHTAELVRSDNPQFGQQSWFGLQRRTKAGIGVMADFKFFDHQRRLWAEVFFAGGSIFLASP